MISLGKLFSAGAGLASGGAGFALPMLLQTAASVLSKTDSAPAQEAAQTLLAIAGRANSGELGISAEQWAEVEKATIKNQTAALEANAAVRREVLANNRIVLHAFVEARGFVKIPLLFVVVLLTQLPVIVLAGVIGWGCWLLFEGRELGLGYITLLGAAGAWNGLAGIAGHRLGTNGEPRK